ncbi:hypothetical protein BCV69DRAFT_282059 [Microstroma glucosiphilum]|uniref:Uncharacterized protein n=1 Tax=Pseudomicrostroma glucosiphilum TaxID=1684307 RepID=A0A316U847_9BASI|nr:hypothetical protein BCV69DRAFT_282059 [Pseudomicrostroma glucosiphilum]PWN21322.1 hypothetical protein BCV69DRAFT_282059 [Pseudomicrostroma glucosiphilum]
MSWHSSCFRQTRQRLLQSLRTSSASDLPRPAVALGFAHRPVGCPCLHTIKRSYYTTPVFEYAYQDPYSSSWASTSSSTSNLDLHPTPVDTSLFEEESPTGADAYLAQPQVQQKINYEAPSPSTILQQMLTGSGEEQDFISPDQLSQAYTTLQQLKELHSTLGPPRICYLHAAFAAFPQRKRHEALEWLEMMPSWRDSSRLEKKIIAEKLIKLLHWLNRKTSKQPQTLQQVLEILLVKKWHSDPRLREIFSKAAYNAFMTVPESFGVYNLWLRLAVHMDMPGIGCDQRRVVMSQIYHIALRHLALTGRFEDAVKLVLLSDPWQPTYLPPINGFTWRLLLEELASEPSDERLLMAQGLQGHLHNILRRLSEEPHHKGEDKKPASGNWTPPEWNSAHVSYLLKVSSIVDQLAAGEAMPPSSLRDDPATLHRRALERRSYAMSTLLPGDVKEQALETTVAQGRVGGKEVEPKGVSRAAHLMSRLVENDQFGDSIATAIASHQLRLLDRSGVNVEEAARLPSDVAPIDMEAQKILSAGRGGKGLWEMAYLWLLAHRRQYRDALHYFTRTWHTTGEFSQELLDQAMGEQAPAITEDDLTSTSFLLWPSSYVLNLANGCLVQDVLSGVDAFKESDQERHEFLQTAVSKASQCYRIWMAGLQRMEESGGGDLRRLDSYAFDPWLNGLLPQYIKMSGIAGVEEDQRVDLSKMLAGLPLFDAFRTEGDVKLSLGSHHALQFLRDMQMLSVKPSLATYTTLLDTLARDAPRAWPLIEHICSQLGMVPSVADSLDTKSAFLADEKDSSHLKRSYLIAFTALLRGLHAIPTKLGGQYAGVPHARRVREWLRDLTVPSTSNPGQEKQDGSSPEVGEGRLVFTEDDIRDDFKLMAVLQKCQEVERQAEENASWTREGSG